MSKKKSRPARRDKRGPKTAPPPRIDRREWFTRFARGVALWLFPVAAVWLLITPSYNFILTESAESLVRLTENPSATNLGFEPEHHFLITRSDLPASRGALSSVRVTDIHFPLIMLGAFFLAVPAIPWRIRLENLGWALLAAVFFHIVLAFFWVKFTYATQLDSWSAQHYSVFAQNFWGLGKHLLDLPFKFSLPFLLWAFFYLREILPPRSTDTA
ncbi:MAG: hypothetical protein AAGD38_23780 [Acidobacteriota bacterium]